MGVVAVRAPHQKLEQLAEYVRGLSESDRRQYFTKEGMREYACLLELGDFESRPYGMVRFLFGDIVSREVKDSEEDALVFITEDLQAGVCHQASKAEVWLRSVEQQLAPPSLEQWARFRELDPPAQRLALNVLVGGQVRRMKEELAVRYAVEENNAVRHFEERFRELLVPQLEHAIRYEGRHFAGRNFKSRLRVAVDYARMQDLLPPADKGKKEAESIAHIVPKEILSRGSVRDWLRSLTSPASVPSWTCCVTSRGSFGERARRFQWGVLAQVLPLWRSLRSRALTTD